MGDGFHRSLRYCFFLFILFSFGARSFKLNALVPVICKLVEDGSGPVSLFIRILPDLFYLSFTSLS